MLTSNSLALQLVATLPSGVDGLFNPWADTCPMDLPHNGPEAKIARLAAHLDTVPRFILCGEAPGYQGCRHSGVAFTSERLLLEGAIPRINESMSRLTARELPFSEPSSTIVWKTVYKLGIAESTVMWNAVQLHPHKAGDSSTNRTPRSDEIALGRPAMQLLVGAFPDAKVVAIGKKAHELLTDMGINVTASIRHPANGGAREFEAGLTQVMSQF